MGFAGNGVGQVNQLVGGVAHGRDHRHDVCARLPHRADAARHARNLLRVGHRGAAVFLDYQGHWAISLKGFLNPESAEALSIRPLVVYPRNQPVFAGFYRQVKDFQGGCAHQIFPFGTEYDWTDGLSAFPDYAAESYATYLFVAICESKTPLQHWLYAYLRQQRFGQHSMAPVSTTTGASSISPPSALPTSIVTLNTPISESSRSRKGRPAAGSGWRSGYRPLK